MDIGDRGELRAALDRISGTLGVPIDRSLLAEYLKGDAKTLLSYEKVEANASTASALMRFLIGAESYLAQPDVSCRYDIFRASRMVPLMRLLDRALVGVARVRGGDVRVERLAQAASLDAFEAALFEIAVAARYAEAHSPDRVQFVAEDHVPRPDLLVDAAAGAFHVECKRFDRTTDYVAVLRNVVRERAQLSLDALVARRISAVVELTFHVDPVTIAAETIRDLVVDSLATRVPLVASGLTVTVRRFTPPDLDTCQLFPSPFYYDAHYGYRADGAWQGLVNRFLARPAGPSFISDVRWEAAVKWRVQDTAQIWKQQRLGFDRLFNGLDQLSGTGTPGVLHVNYERDLAMGGRPEALRKFIETLSRDTLRSPERTQRLAWMVFNELAFGVSVGGRFDFVEHAHWRRGAMGKSAEPSVSTIYVPPENWVEGGGAWGVGPELPPLDP